jgi:hypothetical protein
MVVYTAARLQNLDKADAAKVAQFIRVSTSEGQRAGSGNGELPAGFLPISKSGPTARLHDSAQVVAAAVAAQKAPSVDPPEASTSMGRDPFAGDGSVTTPPTTAPTGGTPSTAVTPSSAAAPSPPPPTAVAPMPATQAVGSELAGGVLPLLILLGAIGCVATAVIRVGMPIVRGRR